MAIKLLRESSETPNISNKDDVRMVRYAYGGYNGVIQKYGEEFQHSIDQTKFRIGSGRAVIDGWEVDIDGAGVVLDFSHMSYGVYYYTVYLEVNAELETAEIKTLYDTADYPKVSSGDDLTEAQSGTARIETHQFKISYGLISDAVRRIGIIPYGKSNYDSLKTDYDNLNSELSRFMSSTSSALSSHENVIDTHTMQISDIESRLSQLGFREGVVTHNVAPSYVSLNSLKRQGKYVLFNFEASNAQVVPQELTMSIPEGFRPKDDNLIVFGQSFAQAGGVLVSGLYMKSSGSIYFGPYASPKGGFRFLNVGWETADS